MEKIKVDYKGKEIEVERLSDGKFRIPDAVKKIQDSYSYNPKPAVEVVIVVMKPLSEKSYTDQVLKNRKGVVWFNDCKIPFVSEGDMKSSETGYTHTGHQAYGESDIYGDAFKRPCQDDDDRVHPSPQGRFPSNLLVSDDVLNTGKEWKSGGSVTGNEPSLPTTNIYGKYKQRLPWQSYDDSGSFSRYFDIDAWWQERIKKLPKEVQKTFPFLVVPKASKSEKDKGLKYLPTKDIPYSEYRENYDTTKSYVSEYPDGKPRPMNKMKNNHPTCKPVKLMSYLITIGSRKGDTVLDPFVGSGTVSLAAKMLSRKSIGIEINPEYVKIAKARLKSISSLDEWL